MPCCLATCSARRSLLRRLTSAKSAKNRGLSASGFEPLQFVVVPEKFIADMVGDQLTQVGIRRGQPAPLGMPLVMAVNFAGNMNIKILKVRVFRIRP